MVASDMGLTSYRSRERVGDDSNTLSLSQDMSVALRLRSMTRVVPLPSDVSGSLRNGMNEVRLELQRDKLPCDPNKVWHRKATRTTTQVITYWIRPGA